MSIVVKNNIHWVGQRDWEVRDFHGTEYKTLRGSSYNSYLIREEKNVLIDTVDHKFSREFVQNLRNEIDLADIDYIVINHAEEDHAGALTELMAQIPDTPIYCTANAIDSINGHHHHPEWNFNVVKTGDTLDIGNGKQLIFVETPMLHWPDSMMTYLTGDAVLFSNDAFGQHYCDEHLFNDEVDQTELFEQCQRYYANILTPFSRLVTPKITEILGFNLHCGSLNISVDPFKSTVLVSIFHLHGGIPDNDRSPRIHLSLDDDSGLFLWIELHLQFLHARVFLRQALFLCLHRCCGIPDIIQLVRSKTHSSVFFLCETGKNWLNTPNIFNDLRNFFLEFHIFCFFLRVHSDLYHGRCPQCRSQSLHFDSLTGTYMSPSDKASLTGYLDLRRCRHIAMQNRLRIHVTTGTDRRIFEKFGNDIATGLRMPFAIPFIPRAMIMFPPASMQAPSTTPLMITLPPALISKLEETLPRTCTLPSNSIFPVDRSTFSTS